MHLLLAAEDSATFLLEELRRAQPAGRHQRLAPTANSPVLGDLIGTDALPSGPVVFSRQALPAAKAVSAASIRLWSDLLFAGLKPLPDQPWQLHVLPETNRSRLVREGLVDRLRQQRRHLLRALASGPFAADQALVQLVLTSPETGWLSVSRPPLPRDLVTPFPGGQVPVAVDKAAPARAFAKLVEAETRLARPIATGETCVDLGASPGSWSYVALQRGARVLAIDRAPLRADLMRNPRLEFRQGDAFKFLPEQPVDWLLCDVIAAPERSIELLLHWLTQRRCRRFVVTIKFKGEPDYAALDRLKAQLPALCRAVQVRRLCANKNEACVFGEAAV